ncbi:MAG: N-acetylmuramoyl-L-alanine amidase [Cloacibacillus porcorum]|nr:N-acetylmuramoyl-L-alanine amidase [Cloacibacillus porcorum]
MDNREFYALCMAHAGQFNPYAALVQCNWETRGSGGHPWSSELFLQANNCAGLKAWSGWKGDVYEKVSWESVNGKRVDRLSRFCRYPSVDAFLGDYAAKLAANYPLSAARKDNFWGALDGLVSGSYRWATDPDYMERLFRVAAALGREIFGSMWRNKLLNALEYAMSRKYLTQTNTDTAMRVLQEATRGNRSPVNAKEVFSDAGGIPVAIDFGHGGRDPGCVSCGFMEKDCTRLYGEALGRELSRRGYEVFYTRVGDEYVGLRDRADKANGWKVRFLLSVHFNSVPDNGKPNGMEVWVSDSAGQTSRSFARYLVNEWKISPCRGIKRKGLTVLACSYMPAALVEVAFLSNAADRRNMQEAKWRDKAVTAMANALDAALKG